jgi:hypothetical protein
LVRPLTRFGSLEYLFRLDCEAEGNFRRAVEDLQQMIAEQAAVLALGAANGIQFNAAIAGIAFGADDVGPSHPAYMPPTAGLCKPLAAFSRVLSSAGLIKLSGIFLFELDLFGRNRFPPFPITARFSEPQSNGFQLTDDPRGRQSRAAGIRVDEKRLARLGLRQGIMHTAAADGGFDA